MISRMLEAAGFLKRLITFADVRHLAALPRTTGIRSIVSSSRRPSRRARHA
jgi:hypothetical protein